MNGFCIQCNMKLFKLLFKFALKAFFQTKIGQQLHTDYTAADYNEKKDSNLATQENRSS